MVRFTLIVLIALLGTPACKSTTGNNHNKLSEFDESPWRDPNRIQRVRNNFNTFRM